MTSRTAECVVSVFAACFISSLSGCAADKSSPSRSSTGEVPSREDAATAVGAADVRSLIASALVTKVVDAEQPLSKMPSTESLVIHVPRNIPIGMGFGFNSLTGDVLAPCVETRGVPIETITSKPGGQQTQSQVMAVSSLEKLYSMWGIDASASFDTGVWKGNSKVNFVRSQSSNRFNAFLAIMVQVENQTETLQQFTLTPDASEALKRGRMDFLAKCGDHFVAGRTTGGRFDAIATIKTETVKEESTLTAEGGGSYYGMGGELRFREDFKREFDHRAQQIKILRDGGEGELPAESFSALEVAGRQFPPTVTIASGKAWPIFVGTKPFIAAQGVRAGDYVDLKPARDRITALGSLKNQAVESRDAARFATNHPYQFAPFNPNDLKSLIADLDRAIEAIDGEANACRASAPDLISCLSPIKTKLPKGSLPQRVLEDRVFVGVDPENNGLLGFGTPFRGGKSRPFGFTFTNSNQRVYLGRAQPPCQFAILYDFSAAFCADPKGMLSDSSSDGAPIYRGLIPRVNQGMLSMRADFALPTCDGGGNKYDISKTGPGMRAKECTAISQIYGYLRKAP